MKAIPVVMICALLAACESKPLAWQKAGMSDTDRSGDAQACSLKARTAPSLYPATPQSAYAAPVSLSVDDTRAQFELAEFGRCMEEKGYSAQR
jgi:hypothetical protein